MAISKRPRKGSGAARVAIIMGSQSDWATMEIAEKTLSDLEIESDARVISAHRTPKRLTSFLASAEEEGIEVIIAGAGCAAHLAGVTASHTLLQQPSATRQRNDAHDERGCPGSLEPHPSSVPALNSRNSINFVNPPLNRKFPETSL